MNVPLCMTLRPPTGWPWRGSTTAARQRRWRPWFGKATPRSPASRRAPGDGPGVKRRHGW